MRLDKPKSDNSLFLWCYVGVYLTARAPKEKAVDPIQILIFFE